MNLIHAIILGIIQGLTEFIPVSSSGHLILAEKLMRLDQVMTAQQITAFVAVMQLGTLLAVIAYFSSDIVEITRGFIVGNFSFLKGERGPATDSARMGWLIILGTLPIGIVGILARKVIEGDLTKSLNLIGASLIIWALLLWSAERFGRQRIDLNGMGVREALLVGIAQVFALIPGSSRSGTTITGALLAGLNRESAARFSFLLSIPAIGASGLLELREAILILNQTSMANLLVATLVSAIVGYASIAFLLHYLRRHSTIIFVSYRLVIGLAILLLGLV
ncbi:MAG: undecaprenyl-diphosphatase UppP [Acidobacteria bacterium]|nr:undecaprenyl-diphosphatase UppP [Acidobacteriota bacterium]